MSEPRAPTVPPVTDPARVRQLYRRWRWSVFLGITLGYGFYYTTRLSLSVAKKPLIDSGLLDADQMGKIGFALLLTYAFGKTINGFIADHVSPRRFFAAGLLLSAILNIVFGLTHSYPLFIALWGLNGWVQSIGAPICGGVLLSRWFSNRERGTRYGVWSVSHNLGEGLTFAVTALLVDFAGWRAGFLGPGLICLVLVFVFYTMIVDSPRHLGLPSVAEYRQDTAAPPAEQGAALRSLQWAVIANVRVWVLGISSALMYVSRYAMNNWGVLYLQLDRGYGLKEAGLVVSLFPSVGAVGSALSGFLSDRFFRARRAPVTLGYGLLFVVALGGVYFGPPGHPWLLRIAMAVAGFAAGGLIALLGGLNAVDICSKRAAGAAMGMIGGFSYLGAAIQDWLSGSLIESTRRIVGGAVTYDFGTVKYLWVGAALLSAILAATLWRSEKAPAPDR